MTKEFEKNTFIKRFGSMLRVDFKRLFLSRFFYIFVACCLIAPILILVMTSMMDGQVSVDPNTGKETVMEGFDYVWQIIGTVSKDKGATEAAAMEMNMITMCNIDMLCFAIAAFVSIFVAVDFKCGYSKNLFTVRAKKSDYVASKTIVLFTACTIMMLAFFIGAILGGLFGSVSFAMDRFSIMQLILCLFTKIFLSLSLVSLFLTVAVTAKSKMWISIILAMLSCMLFFTMISIIAPLNASFIHLIISLGVGVALSFGAGAISCLILNKTSLT